MLLQNRVVAPCNKVCVFLRGVAFCLYCTILCKIIRFLFLRDMMHIYSMSLVIFMGSEHVLVDVLKDKNRQNSN